MDDMLVMWKLGDPVQIAHNLHLKEKTLTTFQLEYCSSRTNTGSYSCLVANLQFRRQSSYYVMRRMVPSTMAVTISWCSFWLPITNQESSSSVTLMTRVLLDLFAVAFIAKTSSGK